MRLPSDGDTAGTKGYRLMDGRHLVSSPEESLWTPCAAKNVVSREEPIQFGPVSLSLMVRLSVPCRSFHIQSLVSSPCLEVAGRWVAVTIETVHAWRTRYAGLSGYTGTSPLPVSTVLTIARFAWFTFVRKNHLRLLVAIFKSGTMH